MKKDNLILKGSDILIHLKRGKNWLTRAGGDKKLHTHVGYLELNEAVGNEYGSSITSSMGDELWILNPTVQDFITKSRRSTQIIYPKDAGLMLIKMNIHPGSKVVEVGVGSGAFTTHLANLVRPRGHIYSYEIRSDFARLAEANLQRVGLMKFVSIKNVDAKEGLDVRGVDSAVIDVGDPWTMVEPVWDALKGGGCLASVSPTMNQVEKLTLKLEESGFVQIESVEVMVRQIEARLGKTRPAMRMIGHTAYLTFARKILKSGKN
uniref:tRNA methyltransferase complex GCD14 subunit (TRM61, GCD14) n=1 Tax=uncultured marine thaumarchaeote KM3_73_F02 TaxID=1456268 RepID=A0A075HR14_9ARCH|nr:tRNA methyltransferase complex GCD14 subunit (TRM61, GCD14) [uncultured marine thaumarchaeote KM3_73_F02]